jgi:predicted ATP-grasp superfamily ATP-dependent carboligase
MFVYTKVRQAPWDFGTMTLGRAAAAPEIVSLSKTLVRALGFRGICGLEFKRDPRDGQYKFIEINPRAEVWINLAQRCGVNLPHLKYQDMIGEPTREVQTNFNKRIVDLREDFSSYYMRYRKDVGTSYHLSFGAWLRSILKPGTEEVVFNWRDPAPGFARLAEYAERVVALRLGTLELPQPPSGQAA